MKKEIIFRTTLNLILLLALMFACNNGGKTIDYLPPSENPAFLIGKWVEKESEEVIAFAGTNHVIEFTEDEFLLKFRYWTDAIVPDDDCQNSYTAYFRGFTEVTEDSIRLSGIATNESFVAKKAECERYATFQKTFKYEVESGQVLIFNPDEEIYNQIRLEKE